MLASPDLNGFDPEDLSSAATDLVAFSILPVRGVPRDVASIEQLINAIGALEGPVSLDIGASSHRRYLIIRCNRSNAEIIQAQITSLYGSPVFETLDPFEDPGVRMESSGNLIATGRMKLTAGPHLPLLTWRELEENDPVLALVAAASTSRGGEHTLAQVLIHGRAPEGWARPYLQELLRIKRRGFGPVRGRDLLRLVALAVGVIGLAVYMMAGTFAGTWFSLGSFGCPLPVRGLSLLRDAPAPGPDPWCELGRIDGSPRREQSAADCLFLRDSPCGQRRHGRSSPPARPSDWPPPTTSSHRMLGTNCDLYRHTSRPSSPRRI